MRSSRVTVWLLMMALLIPSGMAVWETGHRDSCSRYMGGDSSQPRSQMVETGGRMVEVPCSEWLPRQPLTVQMLCLVEVVVLLVLALNMFGDLVDTKKSGVPLRRRRRS